MKHAQPKRYGRALRRLLLRRTDQISLRVCRQLDMDGLVHVRGFAGKERGHNAAVSLTWKGVLFAVLALVGLSPYKYGRRTKDLVCRVDRAEQLRRAEYNRAYRAIRDLP